MMFICLGFMILLCNPLLQAVPRFQSRSVGERLPQGGQHCRPMLCQLRRRRLTNRELLAVEIHDPYAVNIFAHRRERPNELDQRPTLRASGLFPPPQGGRVGGLFPPPCGGEFGWGTPLLGFIALTPPIPALPHEERGGLVR